jgi:hypothetical protein
MTVDRVDWLVQEINDLLDVGDVGLYEFIWTLRSDFPEASELENRADAEAALKRILDGGDRRLIWRIWASNEPVVGMPSPSHDPKDWADPQLGVPYIAIV